MLKAFLLTAILALVGVEAMIQAEQSIQKHTERTQHYAE